MISELLDLVVPSACVRCDADGPALCDACIAELNRPGPARRGTAGGTAVFSAWRWEDAASVMQAYKAGQTPCARALGQALHHAVDAVIAEARERGDVGTEPIALVPIPSSARSYRRRGFHPVELMARRGEMPVVRVLRHARRVADQRGLGRRDRAANMVGAFAVHGVLRPGCPVVLIDDVVTTGATLDAAAAVLRSRGARVLGAATAVSADRDDTPANDR
ncbi:ComF family protein [Microbacterium sp. ZW T5_56]|uniref:ComF family protein n=1 Tax=Microbacterium sp. ZW T5_56 TaxID=3378081 RepID=UPI0038554515